MKSVCFALMVLLHIRLVGAEERPLEAIASSKAQIVATFRSDQGPAWQAKLTEKSFSPLDRSRHAGVAVALGAVAPMINSNATGPLQELHKVRLMERGRLWLSLYYFQSTLGKSFLELKVGNDSMTDAIGYVSGEFTIILNNKLLGHWSGLRLADQTGFATWIGEPFIAPDVAKLDQACRYYPTNVRLDDEILYWWGRHIDPRGEDHWNSTHTTGSPRNKYHPETLFAVWHFWHRKHPKVHDLAPQALQRVYEQIGSTFINESGVLAFDFGRPHRLIDYTERPIKLVDFRRDYAYEDSVPDPAVFGEGVIQLRRSKNTPIGVGVETFGRKALPIVDKAQPESDWAFSRLTGFVYPGDDRVTGSPNNGGDLEHFENAWFYSAAICTPSELARQEPVMLQNVFMQRSAPDNARGTYQPGAFHSSRTLGWFGDGSLYTWHVTGDQVYLDAARAMLDQWLSKGWLTLRGLDPNMYLGSAFDFVVTRESGRSSAAYTSGGPFVEACWQAAVAGHFFCDGYTLDPDETWRAKWKEALIRAAKCVSYCYTGPNGLAENYECHYRGADGKPVLSGDVTWMSTRHWCADPVAFALNLTLDERSFGWVRQAWEYYKERDRYPWFMAGTEYWVRWHLWCTTFLGADGLKTAFGADDPFHR